MYDINDQTVTMHSLTPDGTLRDVYSEPGSLYVLRAMARAIGGRALQALPLPRNVEMWLDVAGLRPSHGAPNFFATAVLTALSPQWAGRMVYGTAVLAGVREDATASLDEIPHHLITGLVLVLGGRVVPSMRPVPVDGGRAWEWTHEGVRFRAESRNGSPVVRLRFRTDAPDSVWTVSVERDTEGRSAKLVAEEMFRDTTGGVQ